MAAVEAGAGHVQGTLNGLGERTGNTNLTTVIPNLQLKLGYTCLPDGRIERLTAVSHHVAETLNRAVNPQAPYVGSSAFAHKAGLHVSAIVRAKDAYEHVDPELVGNGTRFVVSEMAGRATIQMKADEIGLELDGAAVNEVIDDLKRLEHEGYHFEAADASLELLMRRAAGQVPEFFRVESMRVITDELPGGDFTTEATVKVWVGDGDDAERRVWVAEGNGPVNAIDTALRRPWARCCRNSPASTSPTTRCASSTERRATGAITRVLLSTTDGERDWTTIGVSPNIIEASWRALEDSLVYGLLHRSLPQRRPHRRRLIERPPMAVPRFSPVSPTDRPRYYESPDHVPTSWTPGPSGRHRGLPARGPTARRAGPRPGLRAADRRPAPPEAAAAGRGARRRRDPRLPRRRAAPGIDVLDGRRSSTTSRSRSRSGGSTTRPRPPSWCSFAGRCSRDCATSAITTWRPGPSPTWLPMPRCG